MLHHRAFGRDLDTLVVAVIDNRRPILSLMRAMLAAIGTGRIETYEVRPKPSTRWRLPFPTWSSPPPPCSL